MAKISGAKEYIYEEAVDHNSPLSEDLMKRIGASINYINDNSTFQLGDTIPSILTESQFQSLRGNNWVMMQGQDISSSDLAALTGINTLPNLFDAGAIVNANDSLVGSVVSGDVKSHNHSASGTVRIEKRSSASSYSYGNNYVANGDNTSESTQDLPLSLSIGSTGTTYNYAGGVRLNIFIKINNEPT